MRRRWANVEILAAALGVVALVGVWVWWTFLGRKRLIEDLPTSATTGVALGLNELVGRVGSPLAEASPQSGTPCVWWQNVFYVSDGEGGWKRTGDKQGGPVQFELVDAEGAIGVRPRKAEVSAPEVYDGPPLDLGVPRDADASLVSRYIAQRSTGTKKRRVVEKAIVPGDEVYVLGTAQLPYESLDVYIGPDRDTGTDPFLVRVGTEADAVFTERIGTVVGAMVAFIAAAASGIALADGQALADDRIRWSEVGLRMPLAFIVAVLAVMSLASFAFSYNALRVLRQRAEKAWSLIDVQLRRRHDLIPQLVRVTSAHAGHERQVQTAIAELRTSLAADLPATPTDDAVTD
ncbi:MAG: LemA family protein, partial [Actinomycetota bacterium]